MIVPDTSVWIEFFRATEHPLRTLLARLIDDDADVAVTDCVVMEILAGARSDADEEELRDGLLAFPLLRVEALTDFEEAANIYRRCRARGETIRNMVDCLIAARVIRQGAELLHNDGDFDAIARHSDLRIYPAG